MSKKEVKGNVREVKGQGPHYHLEIYVLRYKEPVKESEQTYFESMTLLVVVSMTLGRQGESTEIRCKVSCKNSDHTKYWLGPL